MKIVSICLAVFWFMLTINCLYEVFAIPKELISPLISISLVADIQQACIVNTVINFIYFLTFLYVAIKRKQLAKIKILGIIILLYIATIITINFIRANG
jgi:hypothetical protein